MSPTSARPSPFLKWAGGKRQLLPHILDAIPAQVETYYEPFIGGGAVFFALAAERRFRRAVLGDANEDLILCYQAIQHSVDTVVRVLRSHRYDERYYYALRDLEPAEMTIEERAARLIYLNRCGYNGLYRVNSKGRFNVPFGRHPNPLICDEDNLRAVSESLRGVKLVHRDFAQTTRGATKDDFIYLDPPYVPLSPTASFTAYAKTPFGELEQERLAKLLADLGGRGVPALLSNSDCPATRRLYRELPSRKVAVRRAINSVATGRGSVKELLVKSFAYDGDPSRHAKKSAWQTSTTSKSSTKRASTRS